MRDNFNYIKRILEFENEKDFYFVQILKRRKDKGNENLSYHVMRLKTYYLFKDDIDKLQNNIKKYCNTHNARAYITLNRQNMDTVTLNVISELAKKLKDPNTKFKRLPKIYDDVAGKEGKNAGMLIDIDREHIEFDKDIKLKVISVIGKWLLDVRGLKNFEISEIKTNSGVHILTPSFDPRILNDINNNISKSGGATIDVQKKSIITLLYYGGK